MTTPALVHCPARLVPPPRDSTGASYSRQTMIASTAASTVRGTTTPMGTCRKFDASVEYVARDPGSNRTSPSTRAWSCCFSARASTLALEVEWRTTRRLTSNVPGLRRRGR
jgi:hypothetical protein